MQNKDLQLLDATLRTSFKSIKNDMSLLQQASNSQQNLLDAFFRDISQFKEQVASKTDLAVESEKNSLILDKIKEMQTFNENLATILNARIDEINKRHDEIKNVHDDLKSSTKKIKDLEKQIKLSEKSLTSDIRSLEKRSVTEKQVTKLVSDLNKEFDKIKKKIV